MCASACACALLQTLYVCDSLTQTGTMCASACACALLQTLYVCISITEILGKPKEEATHPQLIYAIVPFPLISLATSPRRGNFLLAAFSKIEADLKMKCLIRGGSRQVDWVASNPLIEKPTKSTSILADNTHPFSSSSAPYTHLSLYLSYSYSLHSKSPPSP